MFDKHSVSQNIINSSDSIADLLTDAPVVISDYSKTKVAGYITNIGHRIGGLYFGDVYLTDKLNDNQFNKIEVVDTDLAYKNVSENSIDVTGFITYVKCVYDENKTEKE